MNTQIFKCLIVEDEALALEIISDYVHEVPFLQLIATKRDAIAALDFLQHNSVDVIFLDIHLPKLNGLDFLRTLKHKPQVILTTAYHNYALESYDFGVVDYLLKPIGFPRFLQAVNKLKSSNVNITSEIVPDEAYIVVATNKTHLRLKKNSILYVESMREYVAIHIADERIVVKNSLKNMRLLLDGICFQIHRSFLVSKQHITAYNASSITIGKQTLPIGRQYRKAVQKALSTL